MSTTRRITTILTADVYQRFDWYRRGRGAAGPQDASARGGWSRSALKSGRNVNALIMAKSGAW